MHFPIIMRLRVDGYEMYPGPEANFRLDQSMQNPLTIIIGANGLGKSTLLTLVFRLLTGPYDIAGARDRRDLGSAKLEVTEIPDRRTFANRVGDRAVNATAEIEVAIGSTTFRIRRSLYDLRLDQIVIADEVIASDEQDLQNYLVDAAALSSFADWILMLRFITFYMDDRRPLFWDSSAQTTLLRSLFLSPEQAAEWLRRERAALAADSEYRNLRAVVNRQRSRTSSLIAPSDSGAQSARNEYVRLLEEQARAEEGLDNAIARRQAAETERSHLNVQRLRAQRNREERARSYQHAKLLDLASRFPTEHESALLVWNELMTDSHCLVCDQQAVDMASLINERARRHQCTVCGSQLPTDSAGATPITDLQVRAIWDELSTAEAELAQLEANFRKAEEESARHDELVNSLNLEQADRQARLAYLRGRLPRSGDEYAELQNDLVRFEIRLENLRRDLEQLADEFDQYVQATVTHIVDRADAVKHAFDRYSSRFLLGRGELTWQPRPQQIGQSSHSVFVPAYELQLSGASAEAKSVRSNAADVSESQKEFIDLAFRMALIDAAGTGGASLLIDTPESSLDSVFAQRAAEVLSEFCAPGKGHTLVVASNLTDGRLVPAMAREITRVGGRPEIVNLLKVGRPTAALIELREEYDDAYARFAGELVADA